MRHVRTTDCTNYLKSEIMSQKKTERPLPFFPETPEIHIGFLDSLNPKELCRLSMAHPVLTQHYLSLFTTKPVDIINNRKKPATIWNKLRPSAMQQQDIQVFLDTYVREESAALRMKKLLENVCFELHLFANGDRLKRVIGVGLSDEDADYFYHALPLLRDWIYANPKEKPLRALRLKMLHDALGFYANTLRPQHRLYLEVLCQQQSQSTQTCEEAALIRNYQPDSTPNLSLLEFKQLIHDAYQKNYTALIVHIAQHRLQPNLPFGIVTVLLDMFEQDRAAAPTPDKLDMLAQCVHALPVTKRLELLMKHISQPQHTSNLVIRAVLRDITSRVAIMDKDHENNCDVDKKRTRFTWPADSAKFIMNNLIALGKNCYNQHWKIQPQQQETLQGILLIMDKMLRIILKSLEYTAADKYLIKIKKEHAAHNNRFSMMHILLESFHQTLIRDRAKKPSNNWRYFNDVIEVIRNNANRQTRAQLVIDEKKLERMYGIDALTSALDDFAQKIQSVEAPTNPAPTRNP